MALNDENASLNAVDRLLSHVDTRSIQWTCRGVALLAVTAACAGCSFDDLIGGKVENTSYPPVTSTVLASNPGSSRLPSEFPGDVPVVRGSYVLEANPSSNAKTLLVRCIDKSAFSMANQLLISAGYEPQEIQGMTIYLGQKYIVTVAEDLASILPTLRYTVVPLSSVPGMPNIPTFTIPTFIAHRS